MDHSIVYDIDELKHRLESYLDDLGQLRRGEKYRNLLGDAFAEKIGKWEESIRRQKDMPFTMVVCGEFKRGKSSFINALLGEDVVTTDVTTETITLNKISYGPHSNALVLDKGKRMLLTDDQLCRDQLEEILEQAGGKSYQLELKRPIDFLKQVTIVDTPGLSDSLKDFSPMVLEALMQADAVVYMFSTVYPLSQREQMFLKTNILPQKHTDLMIVANYADMLKNEEQYARMEKEIQSRLNLLMPEETAYMVSALDERCRQLEAPRPNKDMAQKLEENFAQLRADIYALVETKCDMVLPDRMERMLKGMQEELYAYLDAIDYGLSLSQENLKEEQAKADVETQQMIARQREAMDRIRTSIVEMKGETETWLQQLILEMRSEIADFNSFDIADVRKYYPIYCIDTMQHALNLCYEYHTDVLYDMLDEVSGTLARNMSSKVGGTGRTSFRFALNNKTWTNGDNVALAVNFTALGDTLLGFVAKGIAGSMRDKEMGKNTQNVYQDIRAQYDKLERSIPSVVKNAYEHLEKQLSGLLQEYFVEMETDLQQRMEQTRSVVRRSGEEKTEIRQTVQEVRKTLERMA